MKTLTDDYLQRAFTNSEMEALLINVKFTLALCV